MGTSHSPETDIKETARTSTNVRPESLVVMTTLAARTPMVPTLVHVKMDTEEMERFAKVS